VSEGFWEAFRKDFQPKLLQRADTFTKIFEYLDTLNRPVLILETGCIRTLNDWGQGQSTQLFDLYAQHKPGSKVYSVDINEEAAALVIKHASNCTTITVGDSIDYLSRFEQAPDLVYLDSYDLDVKWPLPSAIHHLKELAAIMPRLTKDSLVVVDDALIEMIGTKEGTVFKSVLIWIGGKARFVAEYAENVGVEPLFTGYQCGWLNLARKP
jgi:predicted O-methyltransferase YrrM